MLCFYAILKVGQLLHEITERLGVSGANSFALYQAGVSVPAVHLRFGILIGAF